MFYCENWLRVHWRRIICWLSLVLLGLRFRQKSIILERSGWSWNLDLGVLNYSRVDGPNKSKLRLWKVRNFIDFNCSSRLLFTALVLLAQNSCSYSNWALLEQRLGCAEGSFDYLVMCIRFSLFLILLSVVIIYKRSFIGLTLRFSLGKRRSKIYNATVKHLCQILSLLLLIWFSKDNLLLWKLC